MNGRRNTASKERDAELERWVQQLLDDSRTLSLFAPFSLLVRHISQFPVARLDQSSSFFTNNNRGGVKIRFTGGSSET